MIVPKQIDCFKINMKFWKLLGIYPPNNTNHYYYLYSRFCVIFFIVFYDSLLTMNFFYLPRHLDAFIEEMIFYFTEAAVASKFLTFLIMRSEIAKLLEMLESKIFQPATEKGLKLLHNAKKFNVRYWKIVAVVSLTSHLTHIFSSFLAHIFLSVPLELPVCSYSFLSDEVRQKYVYILFFYQYIGMQFHMLCNVNIDTFFLGLMILVIAQLDILKENLKKLCEKVDLDHVDQPHISGTEREILENNIILKFNNSVIHYDEVYKFCNLLQETFSVTLFVQFSMASCIICICLFRFTLPATVDYYVFLATYMFIMVIQILVPCWFGTRIIEKSCLLSQAVYSCDWTPRPRKFKSSLRLFIERANRPLSITGGKMFPLSLVTFSSIINSAYSFFTLLRHMQTRENQD